MQIQLKQLEIEAALRQYISQQGINLTGKTVEIAFTSGRKDNGLSAELTIEDSLVTSDHRVAVIAPTDPNGLSAFGNVTTSTKETVSIGDPPNENPAVQTKTSLFT